MMARQSNSYGHVFRRATAPLLLGFGVSLAAMMGAVMAAQPGHGRVSSVPGAPLEVSIPLRGLTADDLKVLNVSVADPAAWTQAGLTLPAAIDSLSVTVEPGVDTTSRTLVLKSTQAVNRPVIDVLIQLSTASGSRSIQSSYLVLATDPSVGSSNAVRVARGDTLYEIALTKTVPNADIFQVMWAIYESNSKAFIGENMNLLRAGVTLNIPDAAKIRAVDAKYARAMFAKHDQAFRTRRGAGQTSAAVPVVATASTQAGTVSAPTSASVAVSTGDQVRLDSTSPADLQADARVASANELREMQSRVEALQKNVEELKDALQKSQAAVVAAGPISALGALGTAGSAGTAGAAAGTAGPAGSAGAAGTTGPAGAAGAAGTAGSAGSAGATGQAGAVGASGATGSTGYIGSTGSTGAVGTLGSAGKPSVAAAADVAKAEASEASRASTATASVAKDANTQSVGAAAASEVKTGLAKVKQYASDHVLGLVLGISALLALLIALLLKRAGRNARTEDLDQVPREHAGLASDFDQKLQSIDLNLSADDKPASASGPSKTGV